MKKPSKKLKKKLENFLIKLEEAIFNINHPTPVDVPIRRLVYKVKRSPYKIIEE